MNARILGLLVMGGVFLACVRPINAELITIQIEAVVDTVEDEGNYLEGQILPGNIITGYYTYESTTPDTNPLTNVGDYWHDSSPFGIFLSVGDFDFETDLYNVEFLVEIVNNNAGSDTYLLRSYNNVLLHNGTIVDHISWQLDDPDQIVLFDDTLPNFPPVLSDWQFNHLRLEGPKLNFLIDAHVTSAIPEPGTIVIFCLEGLFLRKKNKEMSITNLGRNKNALWKENYD